MSEPVAVPLGGGVIGGETERFTLVGVVPTQLGVSVTEELNPFSEVTTTGIDTFCPEVTTTE
jgi:hypothetical protein